jgi:glycosyltransferase involved in cell wall biosynthesis
MHFHINPNLKIVLKELMPDILITSGSYTLPSTWFGIYYKKKFKYKLLFWSESHLDEKRTYKKIIIELRDFIRYRFYKKFDGFWYTGNKSLDLIKKYCNKKCEFYFIPNLIDGISFNNAAKIRDFNKDEIRKEYKVSIEKFLFICPARLIEAKGLIPFLKLFNAAKYKYRAIILIPGEGELKQELVEFINTYHLDVRLLGIKSQTEMIKLYAISDAFLLPSISDPNPLSCIEAIWAELPLLVSEHVGNYPEVIIHNKNGYVFSYNKPEEAISLIDKMIKADMAWVRNARQVSYSIANDKYCADKAVKNLVYEMLENVNRRQG